MPTQAASFIRSTPVPELTGFLTGLFQSPEFTNLSPQDQTTVRQNIAQDFQHNPHFASLGMDKKSQAFQDKAGLVNWTLGKQGVGIGQASSYATEPSFINLPGGITMENPIPGGIGNPLAENEQFGLGARQNTLTGTAYDAYTGNLADLTQAPSDTLFGKIKYGLGAGAGMLAETLPALALSGGTALPVLLGSQGAKTVIRNNIIKLISKSASPKIAKEIATKGLEGVATEAMAKEAASPVWRAGLIASAKELKLPKTVVNDVWKGAGVFGAHGGLLTGAQQTVQEGGLPSTPEQWKDVGRATAGGAVMGGLMGPISALGRSATASMAGLNRGMARALGTENIAFTAPQVLNYKLGLADAPPNIADYLTNTVMAAGMEAHAGRKTRGVKTNAQEYLEKQYAPLDVIETDHPKVEWERKNKETGKREKTQWAITGTENNRVILSPAGEVEGKQIKMPLDQFLFYKRQGNILDVQGKRPKIRDLPYTPPDRATPEVTPEVAVSEEPFATFRPGQEEEIIQEQKVSDQAQQAQTSQTLLAAKRARLDRDTQKRTDFFHSLISTGEGISGSKAFSLDSNLVPEADRAGFGHFSFGEFVDKPLRALVDRLQTAKTLEEIPNELSSSGQINKGVREGLPGSPKHRGGNQDLLNHLGRQWAALPEEKKQWFRQRGAQTDAAGKPLFPQYRKIPLPNEQVKVVEAIDQTKPVEPVGQRPTVDNSYSTKAPSSDEIKAALLSGNEQDILQTVGKISGSTNAAQDRFAENPTPENYVALAESSRPLSRTGSLLKALKNLQQENPQKYQEQNLQSVLKFADKQGTKNSNVRHRLLKSAVTSGDLNWQALTPNQKQSFARSHPTWGELKYPKFKNNKKLAQDLVRLTQETFGEDSDLFKNALQEVEAGKFDNPKATYPALHKARLALLDHTEAKIIAYFDKLSGKQPKQDEGNPPPSNFPSVAEVQKKTAERTRQAAGKKRPEPTPSRTAPSSIVSDIISATKTISSDRFNGNTKKSVSFDNLIEYLKGKYTKKEILEALKTAQGGHGPDFIELTAHRTKLGKTVIKLPHSTVTSIAIVTNPDYAPLDTTGPRLAEVSKTPLKITETSIRNLDLKDLKDITNAVAEGKRPPLSKAEKVLIKQRATEIETELDKTSTQPDPIISPFKIGDTVKVNEDFSGEVLQIQADGTLSVEKPNGKIYNTSPKDKISKINAPDVLRQESGERLHPWEMTAKELKQAIAEEKAKERTDEVEIFGEAGAKRYRFLQRKSNDLFHPKEAKEADIEIAKMEKALTEKQYNKLFGIGEPEGYSIDELRDFERTLDVRATRTPEELGEELRFTLTELGTELDPLKMKYEERLAWATVRNALLHAREMGWDTKKISDVAIKASASRFSDPADAVYMLERFIKETKTPDNLRLNQTGKGTEKTLPEKEFLVTNRESFKQALQGATNLKSEGKKPLWKKWLTKLGVKFKPDGELDAVMKIADLVANTWSITTGRHPDEWFESHIASVTKGGTPDDLALKQGKVSVEWQNQDNLNKAIQKTKKTVDAMKDVQDFITETLSPYGPIADLLKKYIKVERLSKDEQDRIHVLEAGYEQLKPSESKEVHKLWTKALTDPTLDFKVRDQLIQYKINEGSLKGLDRRLTDLYILKKSGTLFQKGDVVKGQVQFLEDGRAIITAFQSADVSTIVHELAHIFRRDLTGNDLLIAEHWAGVKKGVWTRAAEEKWARGFERYLAEGKAPVSHLQKVFEKFKTWLTEIYKNIVGSEIDIELSPEIIKVFDGFLVGQSRAQYMAGLKAQAKRRRGLRRKLKPGDNITPNLLTDQERSLAFRALINAKNKLPSGDPLKSDMTDLANQISKESFKGPEVLRQESTKNSAQSKLTEVDTQMADLTKEQAEIVSKSKELSKKREELKSQGKSLKTIAQEIKKLDVRQDRIGQELQRLTEEYETLKLLTRAEDEFTLRRPGGWHTNIWSLAAEKVGIGKGKYPTIDKALKDIETWLGSKLVGQADISSASDKVNAFVNYRLGDELATLRHELNLANGDFKELKTTLQLANVNPKIREGVIKLINETVSYDDLKKSLSGQALHDLKVAYGRTQDYLRRYGRLEDPEADKGVINFINEAKRTIYHNVGLNQEFLNKAEDLRLAAKSTFDEIDRIIGDISRFSEAEQIRAKNRILRGTDTGNEELNHFTDALREHLTQAYGALFGAGHIVVRDADGRTITSPSFETIMGTLHKRAKNDRHLQEQIKKDEKSYTSFKEEGYTITVPAKDLREYQASWAYKQDGFDADTGLWTIEAAGFPDKKVTPVDAYNYVKPTGIQWTSKPAKDGQVTINRKLSETELASLQKERGETLEIFALARESAFQIQAGELFRFTKAMYARPNSTPRHTKQLPNEPRWGVLAGQWVTPDAYRYLNVFNAGDFEGALKVWHDYVIRPWKSLHTVWSPSTHTTNFISNTTLMAMNGINPSRLVKAFVDFRKAALEGKALSEIDPGYGYLTSVDWTQAHGRKTSLSDRKLKNMERLVGKFKYLKNSKNYLEMVAQAWRITNELPANLYEGSDMLFRIAHYNHMVDALIKVNPEARTNKKIMAQIQRDAALEARKAYVDYMDQNSHLSILMRKTGAIPFWSFFAGIVPQVMRLLKEKPLPTMAMMAGFGLVYNTLFDDEETERRRAMLDDFRKGRMLIGNLKLGGMEVLFPNRTVFIPDLKDKWGAPAGIDVSKYSPADNITRFNQYTALPIPGALIPYGPAWYGVQLFFNSKYSTGSARITDREKPVSEQGRDIAAWALNNWLPPPFAPASSKLVQKYAPQYLLVDGNFLKKQKGNLTDAQWLANTLGGIGFVSQKD